MMTLLDFLQRRRPLTAREARILYRRGTLEWRPLDLLLVVLLMAWGVVMVTGMYACAKALEVLGLNP